MDLTYNTASDEPIYKQLYKQLSAQILRGELKSGDVLPPIRTVAKELKISVITVKKAWEELENGGFICTAVGKGCFVAALNRADIEEKRKTLAGEKFAADLEYYSSLGLNAEDLHALIDELKNKSVN